MKVHSGGQQGSDFGGIEAARALGIETGGTMPKGWITLDGPKPGYAELYGMIEAPVAGYPYRTEQNVINSDATIRFAVDFDSAGEKCTLKFINKHKKPHLNIHLNKSSIITPTSSSVTYVVEWLRKNNVKVLNVAGNSNKSHDLMFIKVFNFMTEVLKEIIKYDTTLNQ